MNQIVITFLPWLEIYDEIRIGRVRFWNFDRESEEKFPDHSIRERLQKHFSSYQRINGDPMPITVCDIDGRSIHDLYTEEQVRYINKAITALAFAATVPRISEWIREPKHILIPTTRAFETVFRVLYLDSDSYTHASYRWMDPFLSDDGSIKYVLSPGTQNLAFPARKWVDYFSSCLEAKRHIRLRTRIFRGLELYRLALAQGELKDEQLEASYFSRAILLSSALETILDLDKRNKADSFADKIEERFSCCRSRRSSRRIGNSRKSRTLAGWWAYDFYKLRNHLVHGDKVTLERFRYQVGKPVSHNEIASVVLSHFVEELIISNGIVKPPRTSSERVSAILRHINDIDWRSVHKALGWIR